MEQSRTAKLALGTVQFGLDYGISNVVGKTSESEVEAILNLAIEAGISLLDTAQAYGSSEEVIGKFNMNRFDIITKLDPNNVKQLSIEDMFRRSLLKLGVKRLYGVLFHNANSALENPKAVSYLLTQKSKGLIQKFGYSVYTPEELESLIKKYGLPDILQVPFSHLDRRFEPFLRELHEKGMEIHTRSTFLQGLFFMNTESLDSFFTPLRPYLRLLNNIFQSKEKLAGALLQYAISRPFIDFVVIGVNNSYQLKQNLQSLRADIGTLGSIPRPHADHKLLMPNLWPKN